jgi:hypothetical protein
VRIIVNNEQIVCCRKPIRLERVNTLEKSKVIGDNLQLMVTALRPFLPIAARQRCSRWLLVLVLLWQAMIVTMPVAQAKMAAGDGTWETICTMQGSSQVWVANMANSDADGDQPQTQTGGDCPLCAMSHAGIAPPLVLDFNVHRIAGAEVGQLVFTAVYLTRAWSEPATGPPSQL